MDEQNKTGNKLNDQADSNTDSLIWWYVSFLEAIYACAWMGEDAEEATNKPQRSQRG